MLLHKGFVIWFAALFLLCSLAPFGGRDDDSIFTVGSEAPMKPCEGHSGLGHQCSQSRHQVQRLENDMGGAVSIRRFQFIADSAVTGERQPFFRHRGEGYVAANVLQLLALMNPGSHPRMNAEATDNAIGDGVPVHLTQGVLFLGIHVEVAMFHVLLQDTGLYQKALQTCSDAVKQTLKVGFAGDIDGPKD